MEALEQVLRACEAGLRTRLPEPEPDPEQVVAVLMQTPADTLFRLGFDALALHIPPAEPM